MALSSMEKNLAKEKLFLATGLFMRVNSQITILMDMEFMSGVMARPILDLGNLIKCMARGRLPGKMEENMKENIWMTRRMAMVFISKIFLDFSFCC